MMITWLWREGNLITPDGDWNGLVGELCPYDQGYGDAGKSAWLSKTRKQLRLKMSREGTRRPRRMTNHGDPERIRRVLNWYLSILCLFRTEVTSIQRHRKWAKMKTIINRRYFGADCQAANLVLSPAASLSKNVWQTFIILLEIYLTSGQIVKLLLVNNTEAEDRLRNSLKKN